MPRAACLELPAAATQLLTSSLNRPAELAQAANPDTLKYCNLAGRGFVLCHVTRRRWHAEYHFVSSVQKRLFKHYCGAGAGRRGLRKARRRPLHEIISYPSATPPPSSSLLSV